MVTFCVCKIVCTGSNFFPSRIQIFSIPDPNIFYPGSRILIKEFKYFNPKNWFLSSKKYDPGGSSKSRIPDSDPDFLPIRILDPGGQKSTGFRIPDPQHCLVQVLTSYWSAGFGKCCLNDDPGFDFFPSWIPNPNFFHPGSRIPDPHQRMSILTQKNGF